MAVDHKAQWEEWNRGGGPRYPHEKVVQFNFRNFPPDQRQQIRVLDCGCGSGVHVKFFAADGFEVAGLDISEIGISNAKRLLDAQQLSADLRVESIEKISWPDGCFDFICSIGVIDSAGLVAARLALPEIMRCLKPAGKALLIFASNLDFRVHTDNPFRLHGYTQEEVEALLPYEGLSVRSVDRYLTTYENGRLQQNEFLVTLQKAANQNV